MREFSPIAGPKGSPRQKSASDCSRTAVAWGSARKAIGVSASGFVTRRVELVASSSAGSASVVSSCVGSSSVASGCTASRFVASRSGASASQSPASQSPGSSLRELLTVAFGRVTSDSVASVGVASGAVEFTSGASSSVASASSAVASSCVKSPGRLASCVGPPGSKSSRQQLRQSRESSSLREFSQLRQSVVSVASVASFVSGRVEFVPGAQPRAVLCKAFERLRALARTSVVERLSRRFLGSGSCVSSGVSSAASSGVASSRPASASKAFQVRVVSSGVASGPVETSFVASRSVAFSSLRSPASTRLQ